MSKKKIIGGIMSGVAATTIVTAHVMKKIKKACV